MTAGKRAKLARKSGELMQAAPQVVAVRVGRMLTAGPQPSARDRREFQRMGAEKVEAFAQSWQAMAVQALAAQQQWALWCARPGGKWRWAAGCSRAPGSNWPVGRSNACVKRAWIRRSAASSPCTAAPRPMLGG